MPSIILSIVILRPKLQYSFTKLHNVTSQKKGISTRLNTVLFFVKIINYISNFACKYPYLLNTVIYFYLVRTKVEENGGSSRISLSYFTTLSKNSGNKSDQNTILSFLHDSPLTKHTKTCYIYIYIYLFIYFYKA